MKKNILLWSCVFGLFGTTIDAEELQLEKTPPPVEEAEELRNTSADLVASERQVLVIDAETAAAMVEEEGLQNKAIIFESTLASLEEAKALQRGLWPTVRASLYGEHYYRAKNTTLGQGTPIGEEGEYFGLSLQARQFLIGWGYRSALSAKADATRSLGLSRQRARFVASAWEARRAVEDVHLAQADVRIAQAQAELRLQEWDDVKVLLGTGHVAPLDEREAQVFYLDAQQVVEAAESQQQVSLEALAALFGRTAQDIEVADDLERPTDLEKLFVRADEQADTSVQIDLLESEGAGQDAQIAFSRAQDYPQISAVGAYDYNGEDTDFLEDSWSIGVEMVWTMDSGVRSFERSALALQRQGLDFRMQDLRLQQKKRIAQLRSEAAMLAANIERQEKTLVLIEENYQDKRERYKGGHITLTELSDANVAIFEARSRLARLIYTEMNIAHELRIFFE